MKEIDTFERNNDSISVNVYGYENLVYPLRISKHYKRTTIVDLLLIANDTTNHYCLINNMSRLLSKQVSRNKEFRLFCRRCLNNFRSKESLDKHKTCCDNHEAVRPELPKKGTTLSFTNYNRLMRVPFVVYADFESIIKPIDTCQPNPNKSYTKPYQKHTPSSFCYYIKCFDDKVYSQEPISFTAQSEDDDVAQIFVDMLEENVKRIHEQFQLPKRIIFTKADKKKYTEATACHICEKELGADRVRDHCHLSGKFRGAAHNDCNLNYKVPKFFPVILHNLAGYDCHLFIKKLSSNNGKKINCIPQTDERYISFTKEIVVGTFEDDEGNEHQVKTEVRFIDSFKFMASSFDDLTKNLCKEQYKNVGMNYSGKKLDLLLRKGSYPYDYMDS